MKVDQFISLPEPKDSRFKSLVGAVYRRLSVISYAGKTKNRVSLWNCVCDCSQKVVVPYNHLKRGAVVSCGCYLKEMRPTFNLRHGMRHSSEYNIWLGIKDRVLNPNNEKFYDYGGRGITISSEWKEDFMAFYRDMGPRPSPKMEVERSNNSKGYCKENCIWATRKTQTRNKRNNVLVSWGGRVVCLAECAELACVSYDRLHDMVRNRNMTAEQAVAIIKK